MTEENPLDFIDFADVVHHGDPGRWTFLGSKPGSPAPATSSKAMSGTLKHYDIYEDEFGDEIEIHYFRHPDGTVGDVKVIR